MMDSSTPIINAPFRKRLYAYGYDSLIVTVLSVLIGWQLGDIAYAATAQELQVEQLVQAGLLPPGTTFEQLPTLLDALLARIFAWQNVLLPLIVSAIYNIWFIAGNWQATPGKRFCGIHVVNADGSRLTWLESSLRHAASGLSMLAMGLPCLTILFTREKLAPHDMLCRTRVILGNKI